MLPHRQIYIILLPILILVVKMEEMVKIDKFGKLFIPKKIRERLCAKKFEIILKEDIIHLRPVKHPLKLYGTLEKLNVSKLKEMHGEEEHEITA
jgi:AbrB family looped-hinge helix DNA binding protein